MKPAMGKSHADHRGHPQASRRRPRPDRSEDRAGAAAGNYERVAELQFQRQRVAAEALEEMRQTREYEDAVDALRTMSRSSDLSAKQVRGFARLVDGDALDARRMTRMARAALATKSSLRDQ